MNAGGVVGGTGRELYMYRYIIIIKGINGNNDWGSTHMPYIHTRSEIDDTKE